MGYCGCMGYEVLSCEPTRWTQKRMEFKEVWGMSAMGYERLCTRESTVLIQALEKAQGKLSVMPGVAPAWALREDRGCCGLI